MSVNSKGYRSLLYAERRVVCRASYVTFRTNYHVYFKNLLCKDKCNRDLNDRQSFVVFFTYLINYFRISTYCRNISHNQESQLAKLIYLVNVLHQLTINVVSSDRQMLFKPRMNQGKG